MAQGAHIIETVGRALYAQRWQTSLARDLGVSDRLVWFWAAGERDLPDTLPPRLLSLLQRRGHTLSAATQLVEQFINGGNRAGP